ncbi:hypothetical protein [Alkalimarinus coralli]|uniref:hypothetical protein n=1 Tax=Alkalimarinus coralli TaxID=2935863 RepID=UPI00202B5291|nr:hypothetical protein [Alkalimarinus coralli]
MMKRFHSAATSILLTGFAIPAEAELKALDDMTMSNVVGQAYLQVDRYQRPTDESVNYIRAQLGVDIETQINADVMELGKYPRWDEKRNDWEVQAADILIENFSMGHIYDEAYYSLNPLMPKPVKPDGSAYKNGELVPFRMLDPYIEFALEEIDGKPTPIGLRIGYGKAEGMMSGNILSLTGAVHSTIRTNLDYVANQLGTCELAEDLCTQLALSPLLGSVEVVNGADLVYGEDTSPSSLVGEIDEARAMYTGIKNGESMRADTGLAAVELPAQNCMVAAADVCFPLTQFQSLWVGARDENGNLAGPADGMFLSFQTRPLEWNQNYRAGNTEESYMQTVKGAFLNVPAGVLEMDTLSATQGTPRARTEYIDRGNGLF